MCGVISDSHFSPSISAHTAISSQIAALSLVVVSLLAIHRLLDWTITSSGLTLSDNSTIAAVECGFDASAGSGNLNSALFSKPLELVMLLVTFEAELLLVVGCLLVSAMNSAGSLDFAVLALLFGFSIVEIALIGK